MIASNEFLIFNGQTFDWTSVTHKKNYWMNLSYGFGQT